jgi:hypothetical protein
VRQPRLETTFDVKTAAGELLFLRQRQQLDNNYGNNLSYEIHDVDKQEF